MLKNVNICASLDHLQPMDFYTMNGTVLELVNSFNNFGIIFDCKLTFRNHITSSISKAICILGFFKRWAKEFSDHYVTKQLFTSLVRPILEYGSIILDSQYGVHSDKIESVQIQFLLFSLRRLGNGWDPNKRLPFYEKSHRKCCINAVFLLNLINGIINFQFLLEKLYIRVPVHN